MKEDQTELIVARLEHLRFLMESGHMPMFRHRSDMFLFALEAHNIARGLSSRYYRLQEDLDIRFFMHFEFDYWLGEIQKWIAQLGGAEYRVDDNDFFAEGRAKRLTIAVDRLFKYHLDKIPADSSAGSMSLPDDEIHEPFKAIMQMKSTDLVISFRDALREVYNYLLKLSRAPISWSYEKRCEAMHLYLEDAQQLPNVQKELGEYEYFCAMPDSNSVRGQFCYLKRRLQALASHGEIGQLKLSKCEQDEQLEKLRKFFSREETKPTENQIPVGAEPMADDELLAQFLSLLRLDNEYHFPVLDKDRAITYLIRKDVVISKKQEQNLQSLFALIGAMRSYFDPIIDNRLNSSLYGVKAQERIDSVLTIVKKYNAKLTSLIANGHKVDELDAFFDRLFSADLKEYYGKGQDQLLELFEKDRDKIKLKPYIQMLRVASDTLHPFVKKTKFGNEIYNCLYDEDVMADVTTGQTIVDYWSKTEYKSDPNWKHAIKLVAAVEKDYQQA